MAKQASQIKAAKKAQTDTREILLDTTRTLLIEGNTTQVSFGDISGHSGVNGALIRYHFGSKQGLFEALLERDAGSTFAALERLVAAPLGAEEKLRRHVHGVTKIYHRYPYLNRLVGVMSAEGDTKSARFISERFTRPLAEAQRMILEQGKAEGVFREIDPMLFHFSLVGACDHLFHARAALGFLFDVHEIDEDLRSRYADHICNLLLDSIRAPDCKP